MPNLTPDEAFQVTLICLIETAKNIIADRNSSHKKRLYWLTYMEKAIDRLNQQYMGNLPDDFIERSQLFNRMVEVDLNYLLKGYKADGTS